MSDSDYERLQHLKNLNEECIKFKRKERNNRYYTNKKLKLIKEKENNIPTDNQNVNDDRNYNLIGKSDEKKNVSFECENIMNDEVSMLDFSSYNKATDEILNNSIESNLINSDSSNSNNSDGRDESDESNESDECLIEAKEYL